MYSVLVGNVTKASPTPTHVVFHTFLQVLVKLINLKSFLGSSYSPIKYNKNFEYSVKLRSLEPFTFKLHKVWKFLNPSR